MLSGNYNNLEMNRKHSWFINYTVNYFFKSKNELKSNMVIMYNISSTLPWIVHLLFGQCIYSYMYNVCTEKSCKLEWCHSSLYRISIWMDRILVALLVEKGRFYVFFANSTLRMYHELCIQTNIVQVPSLCLVRKQTEITETEMKFNVDSYISVLIWNEQTLHCKWYDAYNIIIQKERKYSPL